MRGQRFLFPDYIHDVEKLHTFPASCCPWHYCVVKCNLWYSDIHFCCRDRVSCVVGWCFIFYVAEDDFEVVILPSVGITNLYQHSQFHVGPTASGFFVVRLGVGRVGRKILGASCPLPLLSVISGCSLGAYIEMIQYWGGRYPLGREGEGRPQVCGPGHCDLCRG